MGEVENVGHARRAINSMAPTQTTPSSRSAARTHTEAHIRSEARQSPLRIHGHHSAEHRYAARFATSCAVSCFAASEPARDRARPLCIVERLSRKRLRTAGASASAAALVGRCSVEVVASSLGCGWAAAPAADTGGAFCSAEFCASAGDLTCRGSVAAAPRPACSLSLAARGLAPPRCVLQPTLPLPADPVTKTPLQRPRSRRDRRDRDQARRAHDARRRR